MCSIVAGSSWLSRIVRARVDERYRIDEGRVAMVSAPTWSRSAAFARPACGRYDRQSTAGEAATDVHQVLRSCASSAVLSGWHSLIEVSQHLLDTRFMKLRCSLAFWLSLLALAWYVYRGNTICIPIHSFTRSCAGKSRSMLLRCGLTAMRRVWRHR